MNSDRVSLFLKDPDEDELYATVFSVGSGESDTVERVAKQGHISVANYLAQLKECVSYKGTLLKYVHTIACNLLVHVCIAR